MAGTFPAYKGNLTAMEDGRERVSRARSRDRRTVRIGVDDPTVSAIEVEHDHPVTVVRLLP